MDVKTLKATRLETSTLSRVWEMWKDDQRSFAMLTAFRGDLSQEENVRRNLALGADTRGLGYGYFWLDGFYIENKGTPEERHVEEDSLFVSAPKGHSANFKEDILKLLTKYNQEAALFKPEGGKGEVFLLKTDGSMFRIGKNLLPNQIAENYSRLRGSEGTFVFANALVRRSNLGIQAQLLELNFPAIAKVLGKD